MQFSMKVAALAAAVSLMALSSGNALAQMTKTYKLVGNASQAEKICADLGGYITTDSRGNKVCILPADVVPPPQAMRESPN